MCLEKGVFPQKGKTGKMSEEKWTKQRSLICLEQWWNLIRDFQRAIETLSLIVARFLSYYYPAFKKKAVVVYANKKASKLVKICTIVEIEPIGQNSEQKMQCL